MLFVGKDVAKVLGYSNTRDALNKHVDVEDKLVSQIATSGRRRTIIFINESGLYALVLTSKHRSKMTCKTGPHLCALFRGFVTILIRAE